MTSERRRLPERRHCRQAKFSHSTGDATHHYIASIGYYGDRETPGELFLNTSGKMGHLLDTCVADAAVAISLALQYGCPPAVLADAMKRNSDGSPMGPMGAAMRIMVGSE